MEKVAIPSRVASTFSIEIAARFRQQGGLKPKFLHSNSAGGTHSP